MVRVRIGSGQVHVCRLGRGLGIRGRGNRLISEEIDKYWREVG